MTEFGLVPGARVRHPDRPDWGEGQIQSIIDGRATVNFEHQGKVLVVLSVVPLALVDDERPW